MTIGVFVNTVPKIVQIVTKTERILEFRPRSHASRCWETLQRSGLWPGVLCASDGTISYPSDLLAGKDLDDIRRQYLAGDSRFTLGEDGMDDWEREP